MNVKMKQAFLKQIPFKASAWCEAMQQRCVGQQHAIHQIGVHLQNAFLGLRTTSGPICSFLWVGPEDVGQPALVHALAEYAYKSFAVIHLRLKKSDRLFSELSVDVSTATNKKRLLLKDAIQKLPHALIWIENIESASTDMIREIEDLVAYGMLFDHANEPLDFQQSMIVITSDIGAERILELTERQVTHESSYTPDLLELVLNPGVTTTSVMQAVPPASEELVQSLIPILSESLSKRVVKYAQIVPFLPYEFSDYEKIIQLRLRALVKRCEMDFEIELRYTTEVVKFLAHEALWQCARFQSFEHWLDEHLYACVSRPLVTYWESAEKPVYLLLQLNDSGHVLRCEAVMDNELLITE